MTYLHIFEQTVICFVIFQGWVEEVSSKEKVHFSLYTRPAAPLTHMYTHIQTRPRTVLHSPPMSAQPPNEANNQSVNTMSAHLSLSFSFSLCFGFPLLNTSALLQTFYICFFFLWLIPPKPLLHPVASHGSSKNTIVPFVLCNHGCGCGVIALQCSTVRK